MNAAKLSPRRRLSGRSFTAGPSAAARNKTAGRRGGAEGDGGAMDKVTIAIMAGGESRRMGVDKTQLVVSNETLLERTARLALETGCRVVVAGRSAPPGWPHARTAFVPDISERHGPLGGLIAALAFAAPDPVLALASDLPRLDSAALAWILEEASKIEAAGGVAAVNAGEIEPLFAVYAPTVLPAARERLATGRLSLRGLISACDFKLLAVPERIARSLAGVNTPEEWAAIQA